jgi:hypothetical protein
VLCIAKKLGVQPGESIQPVLKAYMKHMEIEPIGKTELSREEYIKCCLDKGLTALIKDGDSYVKCRKKYS